MKAKKPNKRFWLTLSMIVAIPVLLVTTYTIYLNEIEPNPHPIVPSQSSIVETNGGYKRYTNNHFKYSFEYSIDYKLVENMEYYKDGFYRQTVLSKDANYDVPNTKFISGSVISFYFYTDRTMTQEIDKIKKDSELLNLGARFNDIQFKGINAVELKYQNHPQSRKLFIPRPDGFLAIGFGSGEQTSPDSLIQYTKDFNNILDSFDLLN